MTSNNGKVLLIYPSFFKHGGLHLGISSLSGVLKKSGYDVRVFDTVFYDLNKEEESNQLRADRLMSKRIANEEEYWHAKASDLKKDLIELISEFKPKVIGITITEPVYELSLMLTRFIKQRYQDSVVVAGGVFPTLSPDIVIKESSIDAVCLGEGETALVELCDRVYKNQDFQGVEGLWFKREGEVYKNKPGKMHDLNGLPYPDFSVFDKELFYRPMQGKLYKMVNIETSRGCPYNCAYCSSPRLEEFSRSQCGGNYYRSKDMKRIIDEIHYQVDKYSPEFIYFSTETFLAMNQNDFDAFIEGYRGIRIPFWIQTRFETITEDRLRALKEVGMFWLTLGVEHGNEQFRRDVLKRNYSNELIIRGVSILNKCGLGASLNNMIGLPLENRALIFDTIKLNKKLFEINDNLEFNVFMFVPYRGSDLYDLCRKNGLLSGEVSSAASSLSGESILNLPKEYKEELSGLIKTFNLYIKLPEEYYPKIILAERPGEEGEAMFKYLSQLLKR